MCHPIQIQTHPFRFQLYLEWILLTIVALTEALPAPFYQLLRLPLLTVLIAVAIQPNQSPSVPEGCKSER